MDCVHWQSHRQCCSLTFACALDLYIAPMKLGQLLHQGQSEAKAAKLREAMAASGEASSQPAESSPEAASSEGGARYGLLNIPEPVAAADADFDRAVSRAEFRLAAARRFQLLASGQSGAIRLEQLQALRQTVAGRRPKPGQDVPDERVGNGLPSAN